MGGEPLRRADPRVSGEASIPDDEVEPRWSAWLLERNRRGTRLVLWIGITMYPLFGVLDWLVAPRRWVGLLWATRLLVSAATLVMFRLLRTPLFARHPNALSAGYLVLGSCGISLMTVVLEGLASPYYAGLSLIIVATGLLFVWPTHVIVATHGAIVLSFLLPNAFTRPESMGVGAVSNLIFLSATAIVISTGQVLTYRTQREQLVQQLVIERTKANLERAHEDLKRLDAFKSRFFANVTHELKTPLALILSPLELMISGEFGELTDPQRATLRSVYQSGARLLRLIGDLLDLSRLEESRLRLRARPTDLVPWLRDLSTQVAPLAERKRLQLLFETTLPACEVVCDPDRLERVFVNLLSNACKHTPEGGTITVSLDQRAGDVVMAVRDTGPGFPPELAERLFERFFQVDSETAQNRYTQGGTGIGLALARELVELHGGTITAESQPGSGATFTVVLRRGAEPFAADIVERRAEDRAVATERRLEAATDWTAQFAARDEFRLLDVVDATERRVVERDADEASRSRTVLVVEDTPEVIRVVHTVLRQHYRVFTAPNGARGLAMALEHVPDVIVTDLMMPEMDGFELTRRVRADARTKHIPVLMLSARSELDDRMGGMDSGVTAYLGKPFATRELLATVQKLASASDVAAERVLEEKMESLETIAGGLAHEINNPLNYVRNALARIKLDVAAAFKLALAPEEGDAGRAKVASLEVRSQKMFDTAHSGLVRIGETVALMRRYSREGFARARNPHDVMQGTRDVVRVVAGSIGRPVHVDVETHGEAQVDCVAEELHQALSNLVQNAIEAVADDTGRVTVRAAAEGAWWVCSVADNGPGISAEDRARIFTPFFTTKAPGKGMGIGLTIVWRVVHALGGTVGVESEVGVGTTFTVRLPAVRAPG